MVTINQDEHKMTVNVKITCTLLFCEIQINYIILNYNFNAKLQYKFLLK